MKNSILEKLRPFEISKKVAKTINAGRFSFPQPQCYSSSDPECCGNAEWQCGIGLHTGGRYYNGRCYCVQI